MNKMIKESYYFLRVASRVPEIALLLLNLSRQVMGLFVLNTLVTNYYLLSLLVPLRYTSPKMFILMR